MALIVGILIVAIAWRPTLVGVTVLAGALVALASQVFATLAQPLPPLGNFGVTSAQAIEGQVTVAGSYTGWFYLYCAFIAALVLMAGWIASNTSSSATTEVRRAGAAWLRDVVTSSRQCQPTSTRHSRLTSLREGGRFRAWLAC
jgi:hypothetical protein